MIYQTNKKRSNFETADKIYNNLVQASKQLRIKVEEPFWIEMDDEADEGELRFRLNEFMMESQQSQFRHPILCLVVLGRE